MPFSELSFGVPSGVEWTNNRLNLTQRLTVQNNRSNANASALRIGYDAANFCDISPNSSGALQFSKGMQPFTDNTIDLGTSSFRWANVYAGVVNSLAVGGTGTLLLAGTSGVTFNFTSHFYASFLNNTGEFILQSRNTFSTPTTRNAGFAVIRPTGVLGNCTNTAGGTTVSGDGAENFFNLLKAGDVITISGESQTVTSVSTTNIANTTTWTNAHTSIAATVTALDSFCVKAAGLVGIQTSSPTAFLHLPASVADYASLRIPSGTAPTSPNSGDIWFDGTDLKMRVGGTTKTFTLT